MIGSRRSCSAWVVHGIAGAGDLKKVGRVGVKQHWSISRLIDHGGAGSSALVIWPRWLTSVPGPDTAHEHRSIVAPMPRPSTPMPDNAHNMQGGRYRQLPHQHHPDHLV